ncbi:hypothetical protein OHA40_23825 [Nocardia sp. NBC_00508]|uniref:hypothetical protein n=1 Tax=Nocardia sp. NBC_00508 TaxID=2975992 RepID=UPI002E81EBB5|nr:hypothetical protein [Nocardia sp. NBC_00508]WUD70209.1 hypothetical protein OHA40_23825 [Nocardia sp. NBC_00508]
MPESGGFPVAYYAILISVTDVPGGVQAERRITIAAEGAQRPACVAESIVRYLG